MNLTLPKSATWVGGIITGATYVLQHSETLQSMVPGNTMKSIVTAAGTILGIALMLFGHSVGASSATTQGQ